MELNPSQRIEARFKSFTPDNNQRARLDQLTGAYKSLAMVIENCCKDSREKQLAFTKLEEVAMWANKSVFDRWGAGEPRQNLNG